MYRYRNNLITLTATAAIITTMVTGCTDGYQETDDARVSRVNDELDKTSSQITDQLSKADPTIVGSQIIQKNNVRELEVTHKRENGTYETINYGPITEIEKKLEDPKYLEKLADPTVSAALGAGTGFLAAAVISQMLMNRQAAQAAAVPAYRPTASISAPMSREEDEKRRGGGSSVIRPFGSTTGTTYSNFSDYNRSRIEKASASRAAVRATNTSTIGGSRSFSRSASSTISARGSFSSGSSGGRGGGASGGAGG